MLNRRKYTACFSYKALCEFAECFTEEAHLWIHRLLEQSDSFITYFVDNGQDRYVFGVRSIVQNEDRLTNAGAGRSIRDLAVANLLRDFNRASFYTLRPPTPDGVLRLSAFPTARDIPQQGKGRRNHRHNHQPGNKGGKNNNNMGAKGGGQPEVVPE